MPKNFQPPFQFLNNQSLGATFSSSSISVQTLDNLGFHLVWSGTPTGTFDVQGANEPSTPTADWVSIPLSTSVAPAGSASSALINLNQFPFAYVMLVYTRTSGTGTLNGWFTGKGL